MRIKLFKAIFFFLIIYNCSSQKNNIKFLYGNWKVQKTLQIREYYELYFSESYIYIWNENYGYEPKTKYELRGKELWVSQLGSDFEKQGTIEINGPSTFSIHADKYSAVFEKINEKNSLEDLITEKINETEFWTSFIIRMENSN